MAGKYDARIRELRLEGKGGRLIAKDLGINKGYVNKRLKVMGLNDDRPNQHKPNSNKLNIKFDFGGDDENLGKSGENFLKFLCSCAGFAYAEPPDDLAYDLLIDFGKGWKRIQAKATRQASFELCRSTNIMVRGERRFGRQKYNKGEIDYFFLFKPTGRCWLVPFEEVENNVTIRPDKMLPGFEIKNYFK